MRASSSNGDYISIERVEVDPRRFGFRLAVEVRQGSFAGAADVWVETRVWDRFVDSLAALERDRRGEATVESMSPGELRLTVRSIEQIRFYSVADEYGEFSSFAPYPISLDGKQWPTSEHYFQAQRFLDPKLREQVRRSSQPGRAATRARWRHAADPRPSRSPTS